jgi:hypothetical protein
VRLSLPAFASMATRQARDTTDPTRRSSAMQLHRIGIAEDAPGRHLLVDRSATGFSD